MIGRLSLSAHEEVEEWKEEEGKGREEEREVAPGSSER